MIKEIVGLRSLQDWILAFQGVEEYVPPTRIGKQPEDWIHVTLAERAKPEPKCSSVEEYIASYPDAIKAFREQGEC